MSFTDEQIKELTDDQLHDYVTNYVWYQIDFDSRMALNAEYERRQGIIS